MKQKKVVLVILVLLVVSACRFKDSEKIKILVPMGATSLSLLGLYQDANVQIDTMDGTSNLQSAFLKNKYDLIVAPINLGAKLISDKQTTYRLSQIITWGNLYLVKERSVPMHESESIVAFGEGTVPQKVLNEVLSAELLSKVTYEGSVNEVSMKLLSDKASVGLLAEPILTMSVAKAKAQGVNYEIEMDLQKAYQEKFQMKRQGYPQAAAFVKKGANEKVKVYIEKLKKFQKQIKDNKKLLKKTIEKTDRDKMGVPDSVVILESWDRMHIDIKDAQNCKQDIKTFLRKFGIDYS